jgi:transcriptional antiterminator RfaH
MDNWFLVYCKPKQELRAQQNLASLGFNSYLPQLTKFTKRAGTKVEIKELLFPRYWRRGTTQYEMNSSAVMSVSNLLLRKTAWF